MAIILGGNKATLKLTVVSGPLPGCTKKGQLEFFFFIFQKKKNEIRKKKKEFPTSRLAVFAPTRLTGNNFSLKGGLLKGRQKCQSYKYRICAISYNAIGILGKAKRVVL